MPTIADADKAYDEAIEHWGMGEHERARKYIIAEMGKNPPANDDRYGRMGGRILGDLRAGVSIPYPVAGHGPISQLVENLAPIEPGMTPAQESEFSGYIIRMLKRAIDTPKAIRQVKAERMFPKDLRMHEQLRKYFTDSKKPVSEEAADVGVGRLASGPGERGFTRRRTLPPPAGPVAAGAPQGGRKKTTRSPSRSSRRRRSTRSRRNRGGAKSL